MHRYSKFAPTLLVCLLAACSSGDSMTSAVNPNSVTSVASSNASDTADRCKNGGFTSYTAADHTPFRNQGSCVSYVEHGGVLLPLLQLPVITSFTFDGISTNCMGGHAAPLFTAVFSGGSATITQSGTTASAPMTSGAQAEFGAQQASTFTLTVTNAAGSTSVALSLFPGVSAGSSYCGGIGGAPL